MHLILRNIALLALFTTNIFSAEEYTNKENIQSSILELLNSRDQAISGGPKHVVLKKKNRIGYAGRIAHFVRGRIM